MSLMSIFSQRNIYDKSLEIILFIGHIYGDIRVILFHTCPYRVIMVHYSGFDNSIVSLNRDVHGHIYSWYLPDCIQNPNPGPW